MFRVHIRCRLAIRKIVVWKEGSERDSLSCSKFKPPLPLKLLRTGLGFSLSVGHGHVHAPVIEQGRGKKKKKMGICWKVVTICFSSRSPTTLQCWGARVSRDCCRNRANRQSSGLKCYESETPQKFYAHEARSSRSGSIPVNEAGWLGRNEATKRGVMISRPQQQTGPTSYFLSAIRLYDYCSCYYFRHERSRQGRRRHT